MKTLSQVGKFIRWQDWGPGKITLLWGLSLYIAVAYHIPFGIYALTFLVFIVFAASQSAFGYVLNDWGDRELDKQQFKRNVFTGLTRLESWMALSLVIVAAILSGLPLALRSGFALLWVAWAFSTVAYSVEPLRLKTKGAVGLIASFVAQWFLPVLITFSAFEVHTGVSVWLLALALTISGATLEIGHQRWDRRRDSLTQAATFAVGLPEKKIDRLYAFALLLDKVAVGLVIVVVALALERLETEWASALAVSVAIVYVLLFFMTLGDTMRGIQGGEVDDPYYSKKRSLGSLLHETLLNFAIPVVLGVAATVQQPLYGIVLVLFLIWRIVLGGADITWPFKVMLIRNRD